MGFYRACWAWRRSGVWALSSPCCFLAAGPGRGRRCLSGDGGAPWDPHARGWQLPPRRRLPSRWPLWTRSSPPSLVGVGLCSGSAAGRCALIEAYVCPAPSTPSPVRLYRQRKEGARRALETPPAHPRRQQGVGSSNDQQCLTGEALAGWRKHRSGLCMFGIDPRQVVFSVNKAFSNLSALCNCTLKWDKL